MALERRKRSKQFLRNKPTNIETKDDAFFGVYDLPPYFGEGKNTFRIKPTGLAKGSKIDIEITDSNGNPVYWEVPTYKSVDKSRIISVWIYDGSDSNYVTPDGNLEITIVGKDTRNRVVRYRKTVKVQKTRTSTSEIIFSSDNLPSLSLSSSVETFVNKPQSSQELTQTQQVNQVRYIKSNFGNTVSYEATSGDSFTQEMVSGSIELDFSSVSLLPNLTGQTQPTSVTHSISGIASSTVLRVENPITQSDTRDSDSVHTYFESDGSVTGTIKFLSTGSDSGTQNQVSIANITISNTNPIAGRISSVNTLIKSEGLPSSEFQLISNIVVPNEDTIEYKVQIPTEHLHDPKTLKVQFLNSAGDVSTTELKIENVVFSGGNVFVAGDQGLITGSFHIGSVIGSGLEMAGHSSGYIKSVGYRGFTSASEGKGPGGFLMWSGSGNLTIGANDYQGVGMEMVAAGGSSSFFFTTEDGGNLKIITDEFFIGTEDTQFISGSNGNIEISSSFFHLNPKDSEAEIGGFVITETAISSSQVITGLGTPLALKSNGDITGSAVIVRQRRDGTNYTLFDTNKGIVDARNNGRQIISDSTEYVRENVDDAQAYTTVAEYPIQLMPEETHMTFSYMMDVRAKDGPSSNSGRLRFRLVRFESGSAFNYGSTEEIGSGNVMLTKQILVSAGTEVREDFVSTNDTQDAQQILDNYQGKYCVLKVQLSNNPSAGAATDSYVKVKNIVVNVTREFGAAFGASGAIGDLQAPVVL